MADDSKVQEFLATMRTQFEHDAADELPLRTEFETNIRFVCGDQWDERIKAEREKANRPCLTFPRMHTFVQQVANEARQNKSEIKFSPAEDGDKETAEIYEGLARHIQYNSKARIAYETALEYAAGGSFGYFRFLPEYADDETDDQELHVVPVPDPLSVYGILIPSCFDLAPDHAFVVTEMPVAQYKQQFPNSEVTSDFDGSVQNSEGWVSTETVRVAEYWWVEEGEAKKVGKRSVAQKKVKFCKTNGVEILEESEWLGKRIPIFPVLGKLIIDRGKPKLFSVVSYQRDAQKLINVYKTRIAETLGTAPITPFVAAEGQIEGHEGEWAKANTNPTAVLTYKPETVEGKMLPPPQRQVYEPPIMALSNAAAQEIDDMKAQAGIFDASLGAKSNETTGIAIARRQQQADVVNMHFLDNLERAYQESGRELARVIPLYYDTPRTVRILGVDEQPKLVKVNQDVTEGEQIKRFNIGGEGVGKYDIIVSMGKTYSSKRMESFDMMAQIIQANPNILPLIGDVLFANSDVAGSDQLAERFKKGLPPNLQEQKEGEQEIPPQVMAQLQQMQQQLQAMNEYAKGKEQEARDLQQKIDSKQIDNQARFEIEKLKIEAQVAIAEINAKIQESMQRMKLEYDLNTKLGVEASQFAMQQEQNEFQASQADASRAHEMTKMQGQQQYDMAMADRQQAAQSAGDAAQQM